jgi:hypothetical protein
MTSHTGCNGTVSLQCDFWNVFVSLLLGKMTLNSVRRCEVFHQCELLNGFAS